MISSHVKISMISVTSGLSLKLYLNSLVYHRNIFGSSSKVFGNLRTSSDIFGNSRKMFGNVRLVFGTILENLRKSSESGRKSSENRQKRCYQYVYIIKRTLHVSSKIWILCYSWQEQYLTRSLRSLVRYSSCHSNIKFISSRHRVISSISASGHVIFCLLYKHRINSCRKGVIYYVTITTMISSRVKITCYDIFTCEDMKFSRESSLGISLVFI